MAVIPGQVIVKPTVDTFSYRFIQLENGLQALLVSDPETDKAAASLDVSVMCWGPHMQC